MSRAGDDVSSFWEGLPHKRPECVSCGATGHLVGPVLWRCSVCHAPVCAGCTKTIGDRGVEYHEQTLCSFKCWEAAGRPED